MRPLRRDGRRRHCERCVPSGDRRPARPQRSRTRQGASRLAQQVGMPPVRDRASSDGRTRAPQVGIAVASASAEARRIALEAEAAAARDHRRCVRRCEGARGQPATDEERRHCDRHGRCNRRGEDPPRAASEGAAAVGRADSSGARPRRVADSYLAYLVDVQQQVRGIEAEAAARQITNVPRALGRPRSSLPKMIDEYYWITLTRKLVPPSGSR